MGIVIRAGEPGDCEAIFDVHQDSVRALCAGQYSSEQISAWLDGRDPKMYLPAIKRDELWVAVSDAVVVGFVEVDGNEVTKLFVAGAAAGLGVGAALMARAIDHIRERGHQRIYLESTTTAREFYRRLGFTTIGSGAFSHGSSDVPLEIVKMELIGGQLAE